MPIKVTYQNPGLEYDENMVCEDFLNMGMLPLECCPLQFVLELVVCESSRMTNKMLLCDNHDILSFSGLMTVPKF
jgi:hypothetical protein